MARQHQLTCTFDILETQAELTTDELRLLLAAQQAADNAYAPYSKFLVGAALLLHDGSVHTGNNQENAAYPSGLCAERTAFFGLGATFPNKRIVAVAVTARKFTETTYVGATPCGACRQVMAEYENRQKSPITMLMQVGPRTFYRCQAIRDLLPLQFSEESLHLHP